MGAVLGVGFGGFVRVWAYMGKGGKNGRVCMDQTDRSGMGHISSCKVCVYLQVYRWVCMGLGEYRHIWVRLGKDGQRWAGLDGSDLSGRDGGYI